MNTNLFAPLIINNYIWSEMSSIDPAFTGRYENILPFFPIYDSQAGNAKWGNKPYVIYDNIIQKRKWPLYVVKKEQMLYSIRGSIPEIFYFKDLINHVIDRQDDAGKDINEWAGENVVNHRVFFHCFYTSETNYSSEVTNVKDTRQMISKDLFVEYDFHLARYHRDGLDPFVPGIPGPGAGIEQQPAPSFNWNQATASNTWIINHNLGFKPVVQVFNPAGEQIEGLVIHLSNNQTGIYFVTPQTGYARFV